MCVCVCVCVFVCVCMCVCVGVCVCVCVCVCIHGVLVFSGGHLVFRLRFKTTSSANIPIFTVKMASGHFTVLEMGLPFNGQNYNIRFFCKSNKIRKKIASSLNIYN